jgi:predicted ferric reductase
VTTGVVLPSRVVSLVIKRPPHFTFKPGDYIFVNIPAIASFEWHPFTISSAPEQVSTLLPLFSFFLKFLEIFDTIGLR